ncbi:MAG: ubiquinone/menaquinone biosynthesis methyltransferase [Acidimicrobiales bacterium]
MADMPTDRLPEGEEKRAAVQSMFDGIAPRYDLINRIMTFRLDVRWRREALRALRLGAGAVVADLAAGTGDFSVALTEAGCRPIGFDLSMGMLVASRSAAPRVQADLLALPTGEGVFDAAVCGFALRNLVDLPPFLAELHRTVRPGGRIALLDVSTPDNRLVALGHGIYFNRVVPLIGGALSSRSAYAYLPRSVSYLPAPERMLAMSAEAGLVEVERRQLSGGLTQLITATRP